MHERHFGLSSMRPRNETRSPAEIRRLLWWYRERERLKRGDWIGPFALALAVALFVFGVAAYRGGFPPLFGYG